MTSEMQASSICREQADRTAGAKGLKYQGFADQAKEGLESEMYPVQSRTMKGTL